VLTSTNTKTVSVWCVSVVNETVYQTQRLYRELARRATTSYTGVCVKLVKNQRIVTRMVIGIPSCSFERSAFKRVNSMTVSRMIGLKRIAQQNGLADTGGVQSAIAMLSPDRHWTDHLMGVHCDRGRNCIRDNDQM
jgi:hypothetical protein